MIKKPAVYIGGGIIVIVIAVILIIRLRRGDADAVATHVKKGPFVVAITTSGELEANNSVKVYGPRNLAKANLWNVKIADIVPEGTAVQKGDYIAQLDRTELSENINNFQMEVENKRIEVNNAKLDTAIELQQARNNLVNLKQSMHDAELEVEKSIYEPPVVIKQTEASYEKSKRDYKQAIEAFELTKNKAASKVRSSKMLYDNTLKQLEFLNSLIGELTIIAPEDGMVIYKKDHQGEKLGKNSAINAWDPVVAELPDMGRLSSRTYVNEVDIRKIKIGQEVEVGFDAFPNKKITGKITHVANVGETVFGGNAKVFQVQIQLNGSDPEIKPGMTTVNKIIVSKNSEALFLPIETIYSMGDSLNYVYLHKNFSLIKKEVKLGDRNHQDIMILDGLNENDKVLFLPPEKNEKLEFVYLEQSNEESIANTQSE